MESNDSTTTKVGMSGRRDSSNGSGIVRTVELQTFFEDGKGVVHGRAVTANSATSKRLMEARDPQGQGAGLKAPYRSLFPASRNLRNMYDDDEAPLAAESMV